MLRKLHCKQWCKKIRLEVPILEKYSNEVRPSTKLKYRHPHKVDLRDVAEMGGCRRGRPHAFFVCILAAAQSLLMDY